MYKIYTRILERRLRRAVEEDMEEEQAAFRPGRQTQDQIFTIRVAVEKNLEKNKDLYLAFIDLRAAFDSVPRRYIWEALEAKKVPLKLINATKSVYEDPIGIVRLDGETSREFSMQKGVKQGDSLSPLLFNVFMDEIHKICKRRTHRTKIGNWKLRPVYLQSLLYADDIVLIADTQERLQHAVNEWYEELRRKGMEINIDKSKTMRISKEEQLENLRIRCGEGTMQEVDSYEYLGTIISRDGKIDQEVLNRTRKTTSAYYEICNTIVGKREISTKTKMQIYKSVIVPIAQYGTESLALMDKHRSKLTGAEMKYLRRTVGKTRRDRVRNERIREEVNLRKSLIEVIEDRQLKWYGHTYRMPEERKPKQIMEMRTEGRIGRGRPRLKWEDTVERIGQKRGKTMVELRRMCRDRDQWRRWLDRGEPNA